MPATSDRPHQRPRLVPPRPVLHPRLHSTRRHRGPHRPARRPQAGPRAGRTHAPGGRGGEVGRVRGEGSGAGYMMQISAHLQLTSVPVRATIPHDKEPAKRHDNQLEARQGDILPVCLRRFAEVDALAGLFLPHIQRRNVSSYGRGVRPLRTVTAKAYSRTDTHQKHCDNQGGDNTARKPRPLRPKGRDLMLWGVPDSRLPLSTQQASECVNDVVRVWRQLRHTTSPSWGSCAHSEARAEGKLRTQTTRPEGCGYVS